MATREFLIKVKTLGAGKLGALNTSLGKVNTSAARVNKGLGRMSILSGAIVTAIALRRLGQYADSWTNVNNKLRQVTTSQAHLNRKTEEMYNLAQSSRSSLESISTLYFRISQAADQMGASEQQVVGITESLANQLTAAGLTAGEVNSVLVQTSQAFNKGYLNGDEFRSISEAMPSILRAVSKELKVERSELLELAAAGAVTNEVLGNALLGTLEQSRTTLANSTQSMAQSFQVVTNSLTVTIGKLDEQVGVTAAVADASQWLTDKLDQLSVVMQSDNFITGFTNALGDIPKAMKLVGDGWENIMSWIVGLTGISTDNIFKGFRDLVLNIQTFMKLAMNELSYVAQTTGSYISNYFKDLNPFNDFDSDDAEKAIAATQAVIKKARDDYANSELDNYSKLIAAQDLLTAKLRAELVVLKEKAQVNTPGKIGASDSGAANSARGMLQADGGQAAVSAIYGEDMINKHQADLDLLIDHNERVRLVKLNYLTQDQADIDLARDTELTKANEVFEATLEKLGIENAQKLGITDQYKKQEAEINKKYNNRMVDADKKLTKQRIQSGLSSIGMLSQLNEKSQGLQRVSIVASTASAVMSSYENAGGYPFGLIPAGIMAAVGAKQLSQVGKKNISGGGGGGGGGAAASPGINSSSLSSQAYVTTESTIATDILNELRNRDPNELHTTDYVRKMLASVMDGQNTGTI